VPQIGTFTMFEMPTGSYDKGLGVGKVWYRLPLWLQKNIGPWLLDGGAGETVVPQVQYRDFPYGDSCSSTPSRATGWSRGARFSRTARRGLPRRKLRLPP